MDRKMFPLLVTITIFLISSSHSACSDHIQGDEADVMWLQAKELSHETAQFTESRHHVLRLAPNEDLLESLYRYSRVKNMTAATIVSAVGSLLTANIRYADQEDGTFLRGPFEIVSLVGNLDFQKSRTPDYTGSGHVHISCSDKMGATIGGHLLSGSQVYTTVEITILEIVGGIFVREIDDGPGGSGYFELKVLTTDND